MLTQLLKFNTGRFGLSADLSARKLILTDVAFSTNSAGAILEFLGLENKFQRPCLVHAHTVAIIQHRSFWA